MFHRDKRGQSKTTRIFENSGTSGAKQLVPPVNNPAARLPSFLSQWQKITKDPVVIDIVRGYKIDFHTTPWQKHVPKTTAVEKNLPLLQQEITKLVEKGAITPVHPTPMGFYSRLFLVPKKGDSFRPVIDLSHLNKFIANEHFQMENLTCIKHLLNVNEYMVKLDLKDAYLTVGVHPESQKFLEFVWLGQTYQFLALPFGLNTAPRIFTKLLKPVVAYLRTRNIRLLIYLDDILIIGSSVQILREHTALVIELLQNLGFMINYEKSLLTPTPVLEFLGFLINSKTMKFYLPQTKVAKVLDLCKSLLRENPISLHLLAQLRGFLESCRPAVWLASLHFSHLQSCLIQQVALNKGSYQGTVLLDPQAREELQWWITNIKRVNGSPIHPPATEMVITSDASKMGWGATFGNLSTNGRCSKQESDLHINVLELQATFLAIQAFLKNQSNLVVKLRLDNTTAVTYVNNQGGTRSPSLMLLTLELWNWCLQRNILITAEHLPGVSNVLADRESRTFIDSSDWKLQPEIIQYFLKDREIDLFAKRLTNQLKSYVSWRPDSHAVATDAFSIDWSEMKGYAFPPFNLIPRTLMKVINDNANIVLVAPVWQTQHWWPLLLQLTVQLPVLLPASPTLLQDPSNPKAIHPMYPRLRLAVWTISNNSTQQQAFRTQLSAFCPRLHVNPPTNHMTVHGQNGTAGVIEVKLIQFQPLSKTF